MSDAHIDVQNLSKTYRVPQRQSGLGAALRSLVQREYLEVTAVTSLSFTIRPGEMVGFIGPNGAGKTTTLKMLAGLLHPTSGTAVVAGYTPWERRPEYLRRISMVLGNKSQMLWDIPPLDTFHVLGEIYSIDKRELQSTLDELTAILDMEELLTKPVRNLSLGERMKCELVAALLHRPSVLFLDEPTLGLDVSMQRRLREFIADTNRRTGATMILTSHYMADVAELCPRVILIHHGRLLYDGLLGQLSEQLAPFKLIRLALDRENSSSEWRDRLPEDTAVLNPDPANLTLRVPRRETSALTAHLLNTLPVVDLSVENPPLEAVIDQIYQEAAV
ncbi:MAG: ATP-binding cassette domain-containing protein [Ardenticatenaceae bacterium]|nr:ATP-binding cassette domain-containing protein [Ardenticatenaceae bacterium]MCB8987307.1 ATP-binding cassette domain-containing protein [Ardenticatenaceae bacterium]